MSDLLAKTKEELLKLQQEVDLEYKKYQDMKLTLDMSRGKPAPSQVDTVNGMLKEMTDYHTKAGMDVRNYGVLDGIPEMKELFGDLLHINPDQIIVGGNASLNLMFDAMMRLYVFGTMGEKPWGQLDKVKFLCPAPGYDRHFSICETLGMEMITVPMTECGPDMDVVEALVANDSAIKGIWCIPKYSNPEGVCYSDETVKRLASMKTAAVDFKIFWDNAYGVHPVFEDVKVLNIMDECKKVGTDNRTYYFFSTSKISFPGAGVGIIAASEENIAEIKKIMGAQTIGYDKINQLRHVQFFHNAQGLLDHMQVLANCMKPKFEIVLNTLEQELKGTGLIQWKSPKGGYFVSVDLLDGCAKEVVKLAKEAGVVLTGAGATYPYKNDPKDSNLRIAPTYPTEEELQQAMNLFCVCVKKAGIAKLLESK